jgi:hypothetical protein
LPRLKKLINGRVHRFLITQPSWIAQWITTRPTAILLPSHYAQLANAIEAINSLDNGPEACDSEDFGVSFLDFPELYDAVFALMRFKAPFTNRRGLLADFFTFVCSSRVTHAHLQAAFARFVPSELTRGELNNLISVLLPIPGFVDVTALFALATRRRLRSAYPFSQALVHICRHTQFACNRAFLQFVSFSLFHGPIAFVRDVVPAIEKFEFPGVREILRRYLRKLAATDPLSDPLHVFLIRLRDRALLREEEPRLLPVLDSLIDSQIEEVHVIDRLFGVLGRDRGDVPSDLSEPLPPFWRLAVKHRDFIGGRISDAPARLRGAYAFMFACRSLLAFPVRFRQFADRLNRRRTRRHFTVNVRRAHIVADSFRLLAAADAATWLGALHVSFVSEPGVDGGGLLREWFSCLTRELFGAPAALFQPAGARRAFQPTPSGDPPFMVFAGKLVALAVVNSVQLAVHLARPFLKRILGRAVALEDLRDVDETMYNGMQWILENSVADLPSELVFAVSVGAHAQVELTPDGAAVAVTDENKAEYVERVVQYHLRDGIENQASAFCRGFYELIALEDLGAFDAHELDAIICGENTIDVDDWERNCEYQGTYSASHPVVGLFFSVIKGWSQENLSKLLAFATGSSQVPLGGFSAFRESGRPMVIGSGGGKERLIAAHTCANTIDLPMYETVAEMNEKLMFAIENCAGYGFR